MPQGAQKVQGRLAEVDVGTPVNHQGQCAQRQSEVDLHASAAVLLLAQYVRTKPDRVECGCMRGFCVRGIEYVGVAWVPCGV